MLSLVPFAGHAAVVVTVEVNAIGHYYNFLSLDYLASTYEEDEASAFPSFEVNLADYNSITLRFVAPEGQRFHWDPSDGENENFIAELDLFIDYGIYDWELDTLDELTGSLTFIDYVGDPMPVPEIFAYIGADGSFISFESCGCFDIPSVPAFFSGFELVVDYSTITERTGWVARTYTAENSFVAFIIPPFLEDDPGQRLTLVPVPEPASAAMFAGLALIGWLRLRRRRIGLI